MPLRIEVIKKGKPIEKVITEIKEFPVKAKNDLIKLAQQVLNKMHRNINAERKRDKKVHGLSPKDSKMSLIDAIQIEYFENGWGIGNISYLKANSPHYLAINWGSNHIVGKVLYGHFGENSKPRSSGKRQPFYATEPWYSMIPKKPIVGINYIEKTNFFLVGKIQDIIAKWSKK